MKKTIHVDSSERNGIKIKLREREVTRINESNSETEKERWNLRIAPVELFKFRWGFINFSSIF